MIEAWAKLQTGTDIRGIAIETSDHQVNLTASVSKKIAYGFVKWLQEEKKIDKKRLKIAIGMDSRLSGPLLKDALIEGLTAVGCTVYDCQMSTTPAMFMATILENYQCDGAIMVTASHLPYYYNGLKLFTKDGGCEKEDIKFILQRAAEGELASGIQQGDFQSANLMEDYSKLLVEMIQKGINSEDNYKKPLTGYKIVVDAGNGAGGFFAAQVLQVLGADTTGSQFLEPDGNFPNHSPNPENQVAMNSIKAAVLANKADFGIIFDADVDRSAIVSGKGIEINKNLLIALLAAMVLEEYPNSWIVTDSITSTGLSQFIHEQGGKHHRFKRGYKNVINEAKRLNEQGQSCQLAIETSGHAALKENYFLDDGAYLIAKILIKMAKLGQKGIKIESLIEKLKLPCESSEFRINIKTASFKEYGLLILEELVPYIDKIQGWNIVVDNYEGIRVSTGIGSGDGWFLLRVSLHEPVLALNMESDVTDGIKKIIDHLLPFLKKYDALCLKDLRNN